MMQYLHFHKIFRQSFLRWLWNNFGRHLEFWSSSQSFQLAGETLRVLDVISRGNACCIIVVYYFMRARNRRNWRNEWLLILVFSPFLCARFNARAQLTWTSQTLYKTQSAFFTYNTAIPWRSQRKQRDGSCLTTDWKPTHPNKPRNNGERAWRYSLFLFILLGCENVCLTAEARHWCTHRDT